MNDSEHYLKTELYDLMQRDADIFEFLQVGSLDGIWYWDLEQQDNEWMSPRFWETLGHDPAHKKHLATEWQELINADDLEVALSNFSKHCDNPKHPYDQVVRYRHLDGSTIWIRCRGIAIRDADGKPIRMLGTHIDITSLKRAEEELKAQTQELEDKTTRLSTLNRVMADREIKMMDLKQEINGLLQELGRSQKYAV